MWFDIASLVRENLSNVLLGRLLVIRGTVDSEIEWKNRSVISKIQKFVCLYDARSMRSKCPQQFLWAPNLQRTMITVLHSMHSVKKMPWMEFRSHSHVRAAQNSPPPALKIIPSTKPRSTGSSTKIWQWSVHSTEPEVMQIYVKVAFQSDTYEREMYFKWHHSSVNIIIKLEILVTKMHAWNIYSHWSNKCQKMLCRLLSKRAKAYSINGVTKMLDCRLLLHRLKLNLIWFQSPYAKLNSPDQKQVNLIMETY